MTITAIIDGKQYQWASRVAYVGWCDEASVEGVVNLIGWYRPEELDGSVPLPSESDLFAREIRLETINDALNGKE